MSLWDSLKMKLGYGISKGKDTPLRLVEKVRGVIKQLKGQR